MDAKIQALVDMGASPAQARAALRKFSDVETAAEQIFDGRFDHIKDDDEPVKDTRTAENRISTPDEDIVITKDKSGAESDDEPEDDEDGYFEDYDSDYETKAVTGKDAGIHGDPYAGIFFSKDRKEEVIEVEEEPELVYIPGKPEPVPLMTQSEWMKGCPEGGEQGFLFQLYNGLSTGSCACPNQCGAARERSKADFFAIHSSFKTYIDTLREIIQHKCQKCGLVYCLACGENVATTPNQKERNFPGAPGAARALFHCANLQGVILGIGLHMIEQLFQEQHRSPEDVTMGTEGASKKRKVSPAIAAMVQPNSSYDDDDEYLSGDLGRGKKAKAGTGYAGMGKEDNTGQMEAMQSQKARDSKMAALMNEAQAAIKGLEGMRPAETEGQEGEMTESEKRMTASEKGKQKELADTIPDENLNLLRFCERILSAAAGIDRSLRETKGDEFVKRLHASLPKAGHTPTPSSDAPTIVPGKSPEETVQIYESWANKVRFEYCDLSIPPPAPKDGDAEGAASTPSYKFYFNNDARMLANADIPKRSLAIAKELAVLTTNLPVAWNSSVFLRVDESRVDVIKALITGPEGTPYYNGCFLFDIFLGASYNNSPPSVKYMTTNGGRFRFNPNLYADGKVCLSLLGTWSGPGWISGKSTLLQVLISIQSMILCDEPYLNEPGWSSGGGTPASKAYSANVRRMVVHTAMLGNLKAPPEPFADVIQTHFRLKARSLFKQLDEWLGLDDGRSLDGQNGGGQLGSAGGSAGQALRRDVNELKGMLLKLDPNAGDNSSMDTD
ncbi:hypothetical protein FRC12_022727 [Ceratobasidium sp. 428]|nr:hypothetical protein FRC12_022727 [Ceratobasidium sp. 428]